jgi:hypothetical protein
VNLIGRYIHWPALVLALGALAWQTSVVTWWVVDDAYISFRYAEHLAAGHGLVFNPGEYVEGYTNFLWTVLMAAAPLLGIDMTVWGKVWSMGFAALGLLMLAFGHRIVPSWDNKVSAVSTLLLGTCAVFSIWASGAMEPPLVALCLILGVMLHARGRDLPDERVWPLLAGFTSALAAMSRPDAGLLIVVLTVDRFVFDVRHKKMGTVWLLIGFGSIGLPYFVWRLWYYGYLLPNTFYNKVGGTYAQLMRGMTYTGNALGVLVLIAAPGFGAVLAAPEKLRAYAGAFAMAMVVLLHCVYVIMVDYLPAFRFYATVLPLFCLLAGMAVAASGWRWYVTIPLILLTSAYGIAQGIGNNELQKQALSNPVAVRGKIVGEWLRKHVPTDSLITTNTGGSVPYFSKLRVIETLGLTDAVIAHTPVETMGRGTPGHERGNGAYVLSREPDYIIFGSTTGQERPVFRGDREVYVHPDFKKHYRLEKHRAGNLTIVMYKRQPATPAE